MSDSKSSSYSGMLVIVSAPSGCGKTTIVDRLLKRHPEWTRSVSMTTRSPRAGEKEGDDYYFVTQEAFQSMEDKGELLESARVFERFYGTPKAFVLEQLRQGKKVILAIDVQGMKKIKKAVDEGIINVLTVFVLPPSVKILRERLEGRKTESPEDIEKRMAVAQEEIKSAALYDFTVMNQSLEQTVLDIEQFIEDIEKGRRKKTHAIRTS